MELKPELQNSSGLSLDSLGERTLKIVCNFDGLYFIQGSVWID